MLSFGMIPVVVVDTNVVVSALLNPETGPRAVLRACLTGRATPLMGNALLAEHEDVVRRERIFQDSILSLKDRLSFLDNYFSVCEWVGVYYLWRPNLADESDNHVLELAIAGGARYVVTGNVKDFEHTGLRFPEIEVVTPRGFMDRVGG